MKDETLSAVLTLMEQFVSRMTKVEYNLDELHKAYPFHSLFFRDDAIVAFKRQRSIMTMMGQSLYPKLARIIAQERYSDVHLEHEFRGTIDGAAADAIDRIVTQLRVRQRKPDHAAEIGEVLAAQGGDPREVVVRADLYIGDFNAGAFFAELKAPLPNLDIAAESKHKMLTFVALHRDRHPQAYLAFPYNPFLTRAAYKHSFTRQVMDIEADVLMGEEFWNMIGGPDTYAALMDAIQEVTRRTSLRDGAGTKDSASQPKKKK